MADKPFALRRVDDVFFLFGCVSTYFTSAISMARPKLSKEWHFRPIAMESNQFSWRTHTQPYYMLVGWVIAHTRIADRTLTTHQHTDTHTNVQATVLTHISRTPHIRRQYRSTPYASLRIVCIVKFQYLLAFFVSGCELINSHTTTKITPTNQIELTLKICAHAKLCPNSARLILFAK